MDSIYLLTNTSKGKDLKLPFHCQEILLHCFDVCLPEMSSTYKSPHVLMTFNPSESIGTKVFKNINTLCRKKCLTQVLLTTTAGSLGCLKKLINIKEQAQFHHTRKSGLLRFDRLVARKAE